MRKCLSYYANDIETPPPVGAVLQVTEHECDVMSMDGGRCTCVHLEMAEGVARDAALGAAARKAVATRVNWSREAQIGYLREVALSADRYARKVALKNRHYHSTVRVIATAIADVLDTEEKR